MRSIQPPFDCNIPFNCFSLKLFNTMLQLFISWLLVHHFFAKNTKGIAKGPNTKPIIPQKILFEPLLSAIKYNIPAKQKEIINRIKYVITKPLHIKRTIRIPMLHIN